MRKWRVAKQDGAWQAWDTQGFLRYASDDFHLTLLFDSEPAFGGDA